MDPDLRNFTISMPLVGAFVIGSAVCCCICHRRSIRRRIKRFRSTNQVLKPRSMHGITYVESLEYDKRLVEKALAKVTKLQHREPDREDLRRLAKGLQDDMKMIDQYLSNYARYANQSLQITNQGIDQILAARKNSVVTMPGGSLVNPIFNPLESGRSVSYIFDPLTLRKVDAEKYVGEIQPQNVEPNDFNLQSFPKSLEMIPRSQAGEKYGSFILNPLLIPTTPLSPSSSSGYDSDIEFSSHMEASTSKSEVTPSGDKSHEMQPSTSKSEVTPSGDKSHEMQPSTSKSEVTPSGDKSHEMQPSTSKSEVTPSGDKSHEMQPSTSKSEVTPSGDKSHEMQPSTSKSEVTPSGDKSHEMQPSTSKSLLEPNIQHMITDTQYSQPSTSRSYVQQEIQQEIQLPDIPTTTMPRVQQEIQLPDIPTTTMPRVQQEIQLPDIPTTTMSRVQQEIQCLDIPDSNSKPSANESFTQPNSSEIEAQVRAASAGIYSTDFNGPYSSLNNNTTCAMGNDCPKYLQQSKLSEQSKYLQEKVGNVPLNLLNTTTPGLQSAPTPEDLPVIKLGNKRGLSIIVADPGTTGTP